jgi:2-methylcitrate dehydratase PrpD
VVELALKDGRTLSRRVEFAKGTRENPLTPDEVRAKYFRLTEPVGPRGHAEAIMAEVDRLDRARDLTPLASLLRRKPGRPRRTAGKGRR